MFRRVLVVALLVAAGSGVTGPAVAQSQSPQPARSEAPAAQTPGLVALGVSGGFPSYQTVALTASLQYRFAGVQVKGSWTPAGPFFGVQLRAYPPIEAPVPLFVAVGAGVYGRNVSYHAALGAHVPLGVALRLDLEGGVASVPLLDTRHWAPHVAMGLSYAFPVDLDPAAGATAGAAGQGGARTSLPACATPVPPDAGALEAAFERVLADWLASARATYGSVYTDLEYGYSITSTSVSGDAGRVEIEYHGSVRAIGSGTVHEAEGSAAAGFRWTGCAWSNTFVEY